MEQADQGWKIGIIHITRSLGGTGGEGGFLSVRFSVGFFFFLFCGLFVLSVLSIVLFFDLFLSALFLSTFIIYPNLSFGLNK